LTNIDHMLNIFVEVPMEAARVAIPSTLPGGLDSSVDAHFGHCALYTLVEIRADAITRVDTLPSVPHQAGGCLAAVNHLARSGVTALIVDGMGLRPLMGFQQAGIQVFRGGDRSSVGAAVEALLKGKLTQFTHEFTCRGGHHAETAPDP
jgi:predicted Fe-Mo cluster-binding NifX family protein